MVLRRTSRVVETPEGTGQVLREGKVIAKVRYSLCVEIEEIFARSFGIKREARVDYKSVSGTVSVLEGDMALGNSFTAPSGPFTLVMQDGREVNFYVYSRVAKSKPVRQEYEIQGSGNRL